MDLPPDKAKLLKNYDNEKKWDIICDQVSSSNILVFHSVTIIFFCNTFYYYNVLSRFFTLLNDK